MQACMIARVLVIATISAAKCVKSLLVSQSCYELGHNIIVHSGLQQVCQLFRRTTCYRVDDY